jgi:hypothetical protein
MATQSGLTADAVAPFAIIVPPPNLVANTTFSGTVSSKRRF